MRLSEFRKLRRLSRATLSRELGGVTSVSIWRWETGRVIPQPHMISKIKAYTGGAVTADDFYLTSDARRASGVAAA